MGVFHVCRRLSAGISVETVPKVGANDPYFHKKTFGTLPPSKATLRKNNFIGENT